MDRGTWEAVVHRVRESDTTEATEHTQILLFSHWIFVLLCDQCFNSGINKNENKNLIIFSLSCAAML